jgi:hypothetical protein
MDKPEKDRPSMDLQEQLRRTSAKGEPMPLSQEEVDAMAAGGVEAEAVSRRLMQRSVQEMPQGKARPDKSPSQESITATEEGRKLKRAPKARSVEATAEVKTEKEAPGQKPPKR